MVSSLISRHYLAAGFRSSSLLTCPMQELISLRRGLGFVVDSLEEASRIVENLTVEEYGIWSSPG